jgi:tRNA/tmRNA/rRNA uracil-C5-methylase (TrmA/RlmC/RlmD family)
MSIIKKGICKINILNENALGLSDDKNIKLPYVLPNEEVEFELHEYRGKKNSILKGISKASQNRKEPECNILDLVVVVLYSI